MLTIDLEDYFQVAAFEGLVRREDWKHYPSRVERNVDRLLGILDESGTRATWFVLGWEAQRKPSLVRKVAEHGHEIACHSFWHAAVHSLSPEQFRRDVAAAKQAIEDACGEEVVGYRAPSFSIRPDTSWAFTELCQLGFRYDSSLFPVWHPTYGFPLAPPGPSRVVTCGARLWELPPATCGAFGRRFAVAGGAYWRQFPGWLTRLGLRKLTRFERLPAVLYLHPWELDTRQPRLRCGPLTRLRHYRGLRRMSERLRRVLSDHSFQTARELVEQLDAGLPADGRGSADAPGAS